MRKLLLASAVFAAAVWPQSVARQLYDATLARVQADQDMDAAKTGYLEVLRIDPSSIPARLRLSEIATSIGDWAGSRKLLDEVVGRDEASRRDADIQRRLTFAGFAETHASPKAVACRPEFTQPPRIVSRVEPEYDQKAGRANLDRGITLYGEVSLTGESQNVQVLRGLEPDLDASAIAALRQWRWTAGTRNSKPLVCVAEITLTFKPLR